MSIRNSVLAGLVLCAGQATANAQAVQLPTFRQITVNTTVSVPDSGGGVLGRVGRASSGSSQRGLPVIGMPGVRRPSASRSIGRAEAGGGLEVRAQIHDFERMDRQLLAGASDPTARSSRRASGLILAGPQGSLADIRRAREERQQAESSAVNDLLARGRKASAAGKSSLAKTYFRMAAEQASGEQRMTALAELQASQRR